MDDPRLRRRVHCDDGRSLPPLPAGHHLDRRPARSRRHPAAVTASVHRPGQEDPAKAATGSGPVLVPGPRP